MFQTRMSPIGIEIGASMVDHHAFGAAGRAGRIVQADRLPFVDGKEWLKVRIALFEEAAHS